MISLSVSATSFYLMLDSGLISFHPRNSDFAVLDDSIPAIGIGFFNRSSLKIHCI